MPLRLVQDGSWLFSSFHQIAWKYFCTMYFIGVNMCWFSSDLGSKELPCRAQRILGWKKRSLIRSFDLESTEGLFRISAMKRVDPVEDILGLPWISKKCPYLALLLFCLSQVVCSKQWAQEAPGGTTGPEQSTVHGWPSFRDEEVMTE